MALKYLIPIDLNQNEIRNPLLHLLGSDPGSPVEGQFWYNTTGDTMKLRLASSTVDLLNPTLFNGQNSAYYLSRTNHTGTQLASTISDFDTQVRTNRLDQMALPTASVNLNNQKIINLTDPSNPQEAATKNYVDSVATGSVYWKNPVRVLSTTNINLASPGATIDGVTMVTNDRFAVVGQSTGSANGIYVWNGAAVAATRSTDADTSAEVKSGMAFWVSEGTANADTAWTLTTNDPITLGTTSLTFVQFSGLGQITAGNGLTKTGSTLDVGGTAGRISVAADAVDIDAAYVGQSSITTLGTIATGTWNATIISIAKGGTGAATFAANSYFGNPTGSTAAPAITAGAALTKTDDTNVTLALGGTPASALLVAASLTLGWTGTLAITRGGTGASTAATARSNLAATGKYSATIGDGSTTAINVTQATHGLAANGQMVAAAYDASTGALVMCDITINNANGTVTFTFSVAPASNAIRIVIIG